MVLYDAVRRGHENPRVAADRRKKQLRLDNWLRYNHSHPLAHDEHSQGIWNMAVTLRLTRCGGKKAPHYRVVAADERSPRDGRLIEQIGTYDPRQDPPKVNFDLARLEHWLSCGAVPSETVGELIKKARRSAAAPAKA